VISLVFSSWIKFFKWICLILRMYKWIDTPALLRITNCWYEYIMWIYNEVLARRSWSGASSFLPLPPFVVGFAFLAACFASCFIHVGSTSRTSSWSFADANHPRVSPGTIPFLLRLFSVDSFSRFHTGDKSRLGMEGGTIGWLRILVILMLVLD
jgi:hypothetical protein